LNLAIDRKIASIFDLDDAMKIRTDDNRIVAIGKKLEDFNAIDTGIFVCPESIFEYLRRVLKDGDCSLADGVRLMAEEGNAFAVDIGKAWWQDVDTPEMLARAEQEVGRRLL
jgi:choline kinase